jgi:twitching motility protein PilT
MDIRTILEQALTEQVSDIFIIAGLPVCIKLGPVIKKIGESVLKPDESKEYIKQIYSLENGRSLERLLKEGDDDFSFSVSGLGRFRCNAYRQRGSLAAVLRVLPLSLPDFSTMHIPQRVIDLYNITKGLVLVTGPAGSGKSTTLSYIIDQINSNRYDHIITIEDPIEFLHRHKKSIVSQREVYQDTQDYKKALRAALRQAPNVILLGEMRDFETIATAMTAAETGQLVLSTLHTTGAVNTVNRIIDVFPAEQQQQVRVQLSMVLKAVVSQQLIPTKEGGVVPAFEIMLVNSAIRNLIREGKTYQIDNLIFSGAAEGMCSMDSEIVRLFHEGMITREEALLHSADYDAMKKKLQG